MNQMTRLLKWILKAAIFFALFAFALNNQQDATVHLLFGHQWRAPMMLIVLSAFALGVVIGVLGMLPGWWQRRSGGAAASAPPDSLAEHSAGSHAPTPPHGI